MSGQAMATAQGPTRTCDREPCHGKVVQDRTYRLSMVLDAIGDRDEMTGKRSGCFFVSPALHAGLISCRVEQLAARHPMIRNQPQLSDHIAASVGACEIF